MKNSMDNIPIKVIRSSRKTVSIELKPDTILVRAPRRISEKEINRILQDKQAWIEKHRKKLQEQQAEYGNQKPYTAEELQALVRKAKEVIPEKVKQYAAFIGVDYKKITIRCQRTLWGSCSGSGNLSFNCVLMLLPDEVVDSIVVHELCHRKHMNHSAAFYNEVLSVYPEYRKWERWLKENGRIYLNRIS